MLKDFLTYKNQILHFGLGQHDLSSWVATYQGPIYFYDLQFVKIRAKQMRAAFPKANIYYAMKANSNLEIMKALRAEGFGADIVSAGEMKVALAAGFQPSEIIYSGVGKTKAEIDLALSNEIKQINVESVPELLRIAARASALGKIANISLRLNPNVDIKTHPYIATGLHENKFGMEYSVIPEVVEILQKNLQHLRLAGISLHLGSQMLEFEGLAEALRKQKKVFLELQNQFSTCQNFDAGGGLGILYQERDLQKEESLLQKYAAVVQSELMDIPCQLQLEPGRWVVGHAGALLSQVQYIKTTPYRNFVILDAGMVHLIRPALYQAYHSIEPLRLPDASVQKQKYDVVGPICESADFFAKDREMLPLQQDDFVLIMDAGAYGAVMSSDYNLQVEAKEVVL